MRWNKQKTWKNIPDIMDRNVKKDLRILIIFGRNICDTTAIKYVF